MGSIIDRALDIINDHLKDQTSSFKVSSPTALAQQTMARGGHVLEDDYPTHYLPDVGRQVMSDGGAPRGFEGRVMAPDPEPAPVEEAPVAAPEDEGMEAYHGSPHGFDEFDTSKIGTGEGAQAYGHGLYFAENEDVAKSYRDALTDPDAIPLHFKGKPVDTVWNDEISDRWKDVVDKLPKDHEEDFQTVMGNLSQINNLADLKNIRASLDRKQNNILDKVVLPELTKPEVGKGHMYEVRLNMGPEHLLDWDKPLREQHPDIRKAFNMAVHPIRDEDDKMVHELFGDDLAHKSLNLFERSKGSQAYNTFADEIGSPEKASKRLAEAGIRGIRYLDAGSRGKDGQTGSHNIVVFDPQHIKIKRRYAEGGEVPDSDDEGIVAYAFGNSVPHIEQHIAAGEGQDIEKSYGGAINPLELRDNNLEDEARRLILWSYAAAPFGRNMALTREAGGRTYPVAMPTEIKEDLKAGNAKLRKLSPQEFLDESDPLHIGKGDRHIINSFKSHIKSGDPLGPLKLYEGGHQDGRHRANAAKALGITKVPVVDYRKADGGPVNDAQNAVNVARNLTPMGFYSAAAEAASKIPQRAPIDQIINKLKGSPNVKGEELDWSGVRDAFAGQKSVDPAQVAQHLQANLPQIKEKVYGGKAPVEYKPEYFEPEDESEERYDTHVIGPRGNQHKIVADDRVRGKTNYELYEPTGRHMGDYNSFEDAIDAANRSIAGIEDGRFDDDMTRMPGGKNYREIVMSLPGEKKYEHKFHWPGIYNPIAHLRMSDRDDGKTLHVEEVQSDWGQEKRDGRDVPDAPYIKDTKLWTNLALKRALQEAARGGYDKIVFTPGEAQADRYDISQRVGRVTYNPNSKSFNVYDRYLMPMTSKKLEQNELADHIGKDAAEKLMSATPNNIGILQLQGGDLRAGGAGMKNFYDKLVPDQLRKLVNQHDTMAKIEMHSYPLSYERGTGETEDIDSNGNPVEGKETVTSMGHVLHMTPKLRAAILKGLPAYAEGGMAYKAGGSVLKKAFAVLSKLPR